MAILRYITPGRGDEKESHRLIVHDPGPDHGHESPVPRSVRQHRLCAVTSPFLTSYIVVDDLLDRLRRSCAQDNDDMVPRLDSFVGQG